MPDNLSPGQKASLIAIRQKLRNLEEAIDSLLELALAQPEGQSRKRLINEVSALDSIAEGMRQALDAMEDGA